MNYKFLDKITSPEDVKHLTYSELNILAGEIREFLIMSVSKTGGHLASNLGVVELTLALHRVFSSPKDKIVFDVGHQAYIHKILTGRMDRFGTLRQKDGLSGYPKISESQHDVFGVGHSSTSISAALGFAASRDIMGGDNHVICVIGDGALTGGMAFEALNDAGYRKSKLIVILNDNEMSIEKNVGALSSYFSRISTDQSYNRTKRAIEESIKKIPKVGNRLKGYFSRVKHKLKGLLVTPTIFEEMGFAYVGVMDGHNIKDLSKTLERLKKLDRPVLVHISTRKGKGYLPAERQPQDFHGISRFDVESGEIIKGGTGSSYSKEFGERLVSIAQENKRVVAVTPAMPIGSGLVQFAKKFPERFFDVAIAEQHAVTFCAGLAADGIIPVCALYSSFMQRAYDQILHDVCLQNLHVVFAIDRAGVVGDDGPTHHGVFDISFLSALPNMTILAPTSFAELGLALDYAINCHKAPIAIRYPRGNVHVNIDLNGFSPLKSQIICNGKDVVIFTVGTMLKNVMDGLDMLKQAGIIPTVVHLRTLKPLDEKTIVELSKDAALCVVIEDGIISGGAGSRLENLLNKNGIYIPSILMGYEDCFVQQGTIEEIHKMHELDKESIVKRIIGFFERH